MNDQSCYMSRKFWMTLLVYYRNTRNHLIFHLQETLRKYPIATVLNRYVTKDYKIENTKVTLKKGMLLLIPVYSIHRDPEFYPDPETFNPDRFDKENTMHPCSFIPFGLGPRNCIGFRFGMMQTKAGLIALLTKFRFQRTDRTPSKLEIDPESMVFSPVGGVFLKVEKLWFEKEIV